MSYLLHRRRGHDSEGEDEEDPIVSGMTTTNDDYTISDEDSQGEEEETDSEYDSSEQETDTGSEEEEEEDGEDEEDEDEVEQQPTAAPAVVETSTQEMQQTTTTTTTSTDGSSQTSDIKEQVNHQPTNPPLPPLSPAAAPVSTVQTVDMDYQDLQQQQQEKTIQELREYRRKLAEDPSFVPYVGLFWGHDDRYREDSLVATATNHHYHYEGTRESMPRFSQHTAPNNSSIKKPSCDRNLDPLMHKKWDHSGYEELLRLEEQEEKRKKELIESGQSPSHVDQHDSHRPSPPRLPRYHHYNNNNNNTRGRGVAGSNNRGGHARYSPSQKRPLSQQQREEWPQLARTSDTAGQSISDNNTTQQAKVDTRGSVDKQQDVRPIVKVDTPAADGWGTATTATTLNAAADNDNGWGSTPKQELSKNRTADGAEHGWGALTESTPALAESKQPESLAAAVANTSSQDDWNAAPLPPATTTTTRIESSDTGWGEQPTLANTSNDDGWNTVIESNKDVSGWTTTEAVPPSSSSQMETTTITATAPVGDASMPAKDVDRITTDGWGKPEETPVQDTWSHQEAQNWNTTTATPPQRNATTTANHNSSSSSRKKTKSTSLQDKQNEIPAEEKASSSWATAKLDVQVHTTPSDFSKIDYSHTRRYDSPARRDNSSSSTFHHQHQQQQQHSQQQTTLDDSSQQQQQQQQECRSKPTSNHWETDTSATPDTERHTTATTKHVHNECTATTTTTAATPPKNQEASQVNAGWNTKTESKTESKAATLSWNTASEATTSFDQSHSSSSSSFVRGGSRHHGRSSSSANWNADREWNNKMRQEQEQQQQQQSRKSRGYFSTKTSTDMHMAAETASNSTEGFNTPETSSWAHFLSTGDDDSDVEIILEAEEEPEWSKEDNQVLGMTAPADDTQPYSPHTSCHRMTKSYLSQHHQHDSSQSSPRPEYNRKPTTANSVNDGRHGNHSKSHRTDGPHDDDCSQQPNEAAAAAAADVYRPMYYPTPIAHQHHPHPSYMPMIPNGNGTPMYAMPYPMGPTHTNSSSTSPPHMVHRGESASPLHEPSSSTSPHQFYTSSPPNVVQQQQQQQQQQLPPGYEANGMVYYGMDPSAMYPTPQAFYYYAPPPLPQQSPQQQRMMTSNEGYHAAMRRRSSLSPRLHLQQAEEDGWGPTPDTVETEEQWKTTTTTMHKSSPHHDFQNRKQQQQQQPVNSYYYPQHGHHY